MRARDGKLKIDVKYTVNSIESCPWICENCGAELATIVTVQDATGNCFRIGTECAEAVLAFDSSEKWKYEQKLKDYRKAAQVIYKFRKFIQKGGKFLDGKLVLNDRPVGWYQQDFYNLHKLEIEKPLADRKPSGPRKTISDAYIEDTETGKPIYDGDGYNCSHSESWVRKLQRALIQNHRTGSYKIVIKYDQPWGENAPVREPKILLFSVK